MSENPFMTLREVVHHISHVSEKCLAWLESKKDAPGIQPGDLIEINNPKSKLHGEQFHCLGSDGGAVTFRVSGRKYPKLVAQQIVGTGNEVRGSAALFSESVEHCRRVGEREFVMVGEMFALHEIANEAKKGKLTVKGRRIGRATVEDIPSDFWISDILPNPAGEDGGSVISGKSPDDKWVGLRFFRDTVFELWASREPESVREAETRYERWAEEQANFVDDGMTNKEAAKIIAARKNVDTSTVLRETRRIRKQKRESGNAN